MTENLNSTSLELLKCSLCHNFLSYFPIFLSEGKNICGRCPVSDNAVRNDIYEVIAKLHYFPCRYQYDGCLKELAPEDMAEHEETCSARKVKCPVSNCLWDESLFCLIDHCEEEHSQLMLRKNQEFDVNLKHSYEVDNFYIYDSKLFIVSIEFDVDQKRLECLITDYEKQNQSETSYLGLITLKFAKRSCTTEFSIDTVTKLFYLEMLENQLETTKITASFQIGQTLQEITHFKENQALRKFFPTLHCNSCCKFLLPSIYLSSNGLFYCNLCSTAKSLDSPKDSSNNFVDLMEIFCKYQKDGCTFVAFTSGIKEHEQVCKFKIIKCFFSRCVWEDQSKNFIAHLQEEHKHSIAKHNNFIATLSIHEVHSSFHFKVFTFKGFVFRFVATLYKEEYIMCSVQAVTGNPKNFKYEICIQDTKFEDRIIMRKCCSEFDIFEAVYHFENNNYCCLTEKQVNLFLIKNENKSNLSFRITVFHSL